MDTVDISCIKNISRTKPISTPDSVINTGISSISRHPRPNTTKPIVQYTRRNNAMILAMVFWSPCAMGLYR